MKKQSRKYGVGIDDINQSIDRYVIGDDASTNPQEAWSQCKNVGAGNK